MVGVIAVLFFILIVDLTEFKLKVTRLLLFLPVLTKRKLQGRSELTGEKYGVFFYLRFPRFVICFS